MTAIVHRFSASVTEEKKRHQLLVSKFYPRYMPEFASVAFDAPVEKFLQTSVHADVVAIHKGRVVTVEEKLTRSNFPNFLIETHSRLEAGVPGWIYTSLAHYLLYSFAIDGQGGENAQKCYLFTLLELREWFEKNGDQYPIRDTLNSGEWNGKPFTTRCRMIPREVICQNVQNFEATIRR